MNTAQEAIVAIRKIASHWLTDQGEDGATAMSKVTRVLLHTQFEEPPMLTLSNAGIALRDVLAERQRQVTEEGYTADHDDKHDNGQIAQAAADYAMPGQHSVPGVGWASNKAKHSRRDQLVKAGALILAEIERLDRAELNKGIADAALLQAGFDPTVAPADEGWIEWDADACGARPDNVAAVRFRNGRETNCVSGVNWAPMSDSFRHNQVVAYRLAEQANP